MLNVMTAYRKGTAPIDIHHYAELIALDVLYKYILEVIDIVHDSVTQLKSVQVDENHMEMFLRQLRTARERITKRRQNAYQHMGMPIATQIEDVETMQVSSISSFQVWET